MILLFLDLFDSFMYNPFLSGSRDSTGRKWKQRETEDSLILLLDMPGLGKEDVKVSVDHNNTLIIKGEGDQESGGDVRRFSSKIDLHKKSLKYNIDDIKVEMKNGVLKVTVPKIKEEERKYVINVKVE